MKNAEYIARIDSIANEFETKKTHYAKEWVENVNQLLSDSHRLILWGTGNWGMDCYDRFLKKARIPVAYFCDNNPDKWGKQVVDGITCIPPQKIGEEPDFVVIIAVNGYIKEITKQCLDLGVEKENIHAAPLHSTSWGANYIYSADPARYHEMLEGFKRCLEYFGDDQRSKDLLLETLSWRLLEAKAPVTHDGTQYFIPELPIRAAEAFVDAGAYTGDTLEAFACNLRNTCSGIHYYAFECSENNLTALEQRIQQRQYEFSVETFPTALWDHPGILCFSNNNASSTVDTCGTARVQANTLDSCLHGRAVSWIKMDIEGAEPQALAGCASIIREQKPRLSICTYHDAEHIYKLPEYIHMLRNDYQMILRHHSWCDCETVLYAY